MAKPNLKLEAPSLNTLTVSTFKYIANHPLVINSTTIHPITKEPIHISKYRLYDGQVLEGGLVCSIYAEQPKPAAIFEPYDLGNTGYDLGVFFINVKYSYNELTIGNIEKDPCLIEVPSWSQYGFGESLLTSNTKKNVILEINPGIQLIQDYLTVTKYIIDDAQYFKDFPIPIKSLQIVNQTVKTKRWEQDDTIYFQEGQTLIRFDAYITRGWRDKLNPLYLSETNINPIIN
jgi:hypothetical protein